MLLDSAYAQKVFEDRYAQKKEDGSLETFEDALRRVAGAAALPNGAFNMTEADQASHFHSMLAMGQFLPGGRILANLGGTGNGMLGNCFVIPIADSREGIFQKALPEMVDIEAWGGGVGTNFSPLRPKGSPIKGTGGFSSGPVSFMTVFDAANRQISQGGTRRGAAIAVLNVDHPDILEFIDAKKGSESTLTSYNISVGIIDDFMNAVVNDLPWTMSWNGTMEVTRPAREIFNKLAFNAWENGEPGLFFLDTVNRLNPLRAVEYIEAPNPCGEVPLPEYSMCDLGALNLAEFVRDGQVLWAELENTIRLAVLFLDNCLDITKFPLPAIQKEVQDKRRIGLGVFGLADMLFKMELPYGNYPDTLGFIHNLFGFIRDQSLVASRELAKTLGPYPACADSYVPSQKVLDNIDRSFTSESLPIRRNGTLLSCAPTGTISRLYGCSSGIEPHFALQLAFTERLGQDTFQYKHLKGVTPENIPSYFKCTSGPEGTVLSAQDHLAMMGAISPYVDNAISKTVTLPNSATPEDVQALLIDAWKRELKGLTVYREGSRQVEAIRAVSGAETSLSDDSEETEDEVLYDDAEVQVYAEELALELMQTPLKRESELHGTTYKIRYSHTKPSLYITVNNMDDSPFEIFIKTEDTTQMQGFDALCLALTGLFRTGNTGEFLIDKFLKYESAESGAFYEGRYVPSAVAAIGIILKKHLQTLDIVKPDHDPITLRKFAEEGIRGEQCPECHEYTAIREEGCVTCASCGFSKCG